MLTVGGIIWGGVNLYRTRFPDYAKRGVVYAKYETLLKNLDNVIEQSGSVDELEARLNMMTRPSNLVYLGLEDEDGFDTDIIGDGGNTSSFIINGSGYGQRNGEDVVIISYLVNKFGVENCIIYLLRED